MVTHETPIILLHGLGSHEWSLYPMKRYLRYCGYTTVHTVRYPASDLSIADSVDYVDTELLNLLHARDREVVFIGQSMGGVIANNLHTRGWNVRLAVYIGSPLHGANFLHTLNRVLPGWVKRRLKRHAHDVLMNKERESEPPHDYHTISMGWFNSNFDGCVYREETMLNEENHTHFRWSDHRVFFFNPRLLYRVARLLESKGAIQTEA